MKTKNYLLAILVLVTIIVGFAGISAPLVSRVGHGPGSSIGDVTLINSTGGTLSGTLEVQGGPPADLASTGIDPRLKERIKDTYGKLPLQFEENRGQVDKRVRFVARGNGSSLFITGNEAVITLSVPERESRIAADEDASGMLGNPAAAARVNDFFTPLLAGTVFRSATVPGFTNLASRNNQPLKAISHSLQTPPRYTTSVLRVKLAGANTGISVTGVEKLPGTANYLVSRNNAQWRTSVPTYKKVKLSNVYDGIDLVYYGRYGLLEYDFVVAPGADPSAIALEYEGADKLEVDSSGNLIAYLHGGSITQHTPEIYQVVDGSRRKVVGSYVVTGNNKVSFQVNNYIASLPLVIDPTLAYSTYLGGNGEDWGIGIGIAVDNTGSAYVTGLTTSTKFPHQERLPFDLGRQHRCLRNEVQPGRERAGLLHLPRRKQHRCGKQHRR